MILTIDAFNGNEVSLYWKTTNEPIDGIDLSTAGYEVKSIRGLREVTYYLNGMRSNFALLFLFACRKIIGDCQSASESSQRCQTRGDRREQALSASNLRSRVEQNILFEVQ